MDVQSYKVRYGKKLQNTAEQQKWGGGNIKERPGKEFEVVWACDGREEHYIHRKDGDGNGTTRMRKTGRPKRRWLDRVRDDIR